MENEGPTGIHSTEERKEEPIVLSRNFQEGGYTFLHRVFRTTRNEGEPVTIDSGGNKIIYEYNPDHKTFMEGISLLEGDSAGEAYRRFKEVAGSFSLDEAKKQYNESNSDKDY